MKGSRKLRAATVHDSNLVMVAVGKVHNGARTLVRELLVI